MKKKKEKVVFLDFKSQSFQVKIIFWDILVKILRKKVIFSLKKLKSLDKDNILRNLSQNFEGKKSHDYELKSQSFHIKN